MAIVFVDVYAPCNLPVNNCMEVALCMIAGWEDKTLSGFPIAYGKIVSTSAVELNRLPSGAYSPCCTPLDTTPITCSTPTVVNTVCPTSPNLPYSSSSSCTQTVSYCKYQVEIDTSQFKTDVITGLPYVPLCSDFSGVFPYKCIITPVIEEFQLIPNAFEDTSTVALTLDVNNPVRTLTADAIISPDVDNILIDQNGLYVPPSAGETPNTATDTNSIDITLTGTADRDIQADVKLSANAEQAITEEVDGLLVEKSYAGIEGTGETGDAATDITASTTYVIDETAIITVNNPSTTRDLAFKLDGDANIQCLLKPNGVWKIIVEQSINGAPYTTYSEKQYGAFSVDMPIPLDISAGYETTILAGGSLTIQRRLSIQTITPSDAGSSAGVYSIDMRALWVTK